MRLTRFISTLAISGAVAVLAACTTEAPPVVIQTPTPTPSLTVTTSPSPTPSPSPTREGLSTAELLEILPEHADIPDLRGAMIVARYYLELRQDVLAGDLRALEIWNSLATPECGFCKRVADRSIELRSQGLSMEGGEIEFASRPVDALLDAEDPTVAFVVERFDSGPWKHVSSTGEIAAEGESSVVKTYMRLELVNGLWTIAGVEVEIS